MNKINGLICAPFTAFHQNGELNLAVVPRYVQTLANNGIAGVFINGSSGEGQMLTEQERMAAAEAWCNAAPEGFKVIVHVGGNSVKASQILAAHAAEVGAYATSVMGPTFPKISRIQELANYCAEIASAAPDLPFYYYHIPAFTGINLSMLELLKAVDGRIQNFAGIKYTFESLFEYSLCHRYQGGKFDILHGQDETLLASLALGGAQGCIGGTFNYAAGLYVKIRHAYAKGDMALAQQLQQKSWDLIEVICRYRGNIVAGKQIMRLLGLDLGPNRTPFQNMTDAEFAKMSEELSAIHFADFAIKLA
ncbi:MAG: dihydrodipicolinate synthase family protein [Chromatiaceae bacterium]|jgi:N-acetylneuraminate lyase